MDTTLTDPLIGVVLDRRYRVEARLAQGGMSIVYSGTDLRLDRAVAIKVMSPTLAEDSSFAQHFSQEARSAARLSHLNVVSVYDQGEDAGRIFLVMELVRGRTLRDLIREQGQLSPELAFSIAESMLTALAAAHRAGLIHRDVKPENVLIADDGVLKVADFGLARAAASAHHTSVVMGTVAYVAPEQVAKGISDARTDVYGVGIVLFEMLTGRPPYQGDSPMSVAYQHANDDVPAPSEFVPDLPAEIDDIVQRATRRDPGARPTDAGALLAELQLVRADLGLRQVPIPQPASKQEQSHSVAPEHAQHTKVIGANQPPPWASPEAPTSVTSLRVPPKRSDFPPQVDSPGLADPASMQRYRDHQKSGRRGLIWLSVVLLLGVAAAITGWWFGAGRYAQVPTVKGMIQSAAITEIRNADLSVRTQTQPAFDDSVPVDKVVGTKPKIGTRMHHGEAVTLIISRGPAPRTIPDLTNKTLNSAKDQLAELHLRPNISENFHDTIAAGRVISTDPASGNTIPSGSTIGVVVSKGAAPVAVPTVVGRPLDQATALLQGVGLKAETSSEEFSEEIPKGEVISQTPNGGTVGHGSTVQLTISAGPELIKIPSVVGQSVSSARSDLTDAGFKVKVDKVLGGHVGRVVAQDPGGGSKAKRGTTVTLGVV